MSLKLEGSASKGLNHRQVTFHLGSYYATSYPLLQPLPHRLVDPHIEQSMDALNPINKGIDPNLFFPLSSLHRDFIPDGQSPQQALDMIYQRLIQEGVYSTDEQKWIIPQLGAMSIEESTARFFNTVVKSAYANSEVRKMAYVWRSHGNLLVETLRKPEVVLVPAGQQDIPRVHFRAIQTYCEIKYTDKPGLIQDSLQQIMEISNHVSTTQLPRRFFVGMSLCGSSLTLMLLARGAFVTSGTLNINLYPQEFLRILLGLTSCSPAWNGTDEKFFHDDNGLTLKFDRYTLLVTRVVFISLSSQTRSSKVWFCYAYPNIYPPSPRIQCILKDCWMEAGLTTDIDILQLLRDRKPQPFANDQQRQKFGLEDKYYIFKGCQQLTAKWDAQVNLPGIPIVLTHQEPSCVNPDHELLSKEKVADTTENILRRFGPGLNMQNRKHIRIVYKTIATPITWSSCRREFINGIMGATEALFNGTRKDILHCDACDTNVMLVVDDLEPQNVVPDWPTTPGEYIKRAGVLFDWGYAKDQRPTIPQNNSSGQMTGTFPFTAADLLVSKGTTNHEVYHDLESLFWVMFITSANLEGPFNMRRQWQDTDYDSKDFPFSGNVRMPVEPTSNIQGVPIWTTPGPHACSPGEVYEWKRSIPEPTFIASMSSYWTSGQGGKVFVEGMLKLAKYFRHDVSHDGSNIIMSSPLQHHITPEIFLDILYEMREGIPDAEDCPSEEEIRHARSRYQEMLDSHCGLEAPLLDPPGALARGNLISPTVSKRFVSARKNKRNQPPMQDTAASLQTSPTLKRARPSSPPPEASGSGESVWSDTPAADCGTCWTSSRGSKSNGHSRMGK